MKKVTAYEIIDHGFEHPDYFPGCGVGYTPFEDCASGVGDTALEAYEDALEMLAQDDWDVSSVRGKSKLSRQTVRGFLKRQGIHNKEDLENTEILAHVSIRVR